MNVIKQTIADLAIFNDIVKKFLPTYFTATCLAIISAICAACGPLILGKSIDYITTMQNQAIAGNHLFYKLLLLIGLILALRFLDIFLHTTASRISAVKSELLLHDLREKIISILFKDKYNEKLLKTESHGKLVSLFSRDIDALWETLGSILVSATTSIIVLISLTIVMLNISPLVGIVFLFIAAIFCVAFFKNGQKIRSFFAVAAPRFDHMLTLMGSFLAGYETIFSFKKQKWAKKQIMHISLQVAEDANKAHCRSTYFTFLTGLINIFGIIIVWVILLPGLLAAKDSSSFISIGSLITILFYFNMLASPLETLSHTGNALSKARVSLHRLASFIRDNNESKNIIASTAINKNTENLLSVQQVTDEKAKDATSTILSPISFNVKRGQLIGLAGSSGSGKSTLLRIIGNIKAYKGQTLELYGADIKQIDDTKFRELVTYLPQAASIFPLSLGQNLFLETNDQASQTIIANCLDKVGLHDKQKQLENSNDILAEQLSGGEAQRLAFSRIFNSSAQLLLIDEPTSALDLTNSIRICEILKDLTQTKELAIIVASHDPCVLKYCDTIYLMQDGDIVGTGNMDELSNNSLFNSIISSPKETS